MPLKPLGLSILAFLVCGCAQQQSQEPPDARLVTYTEDREVCIDRNANRNAYFGDLHIHTAYSFDARPIGTRTTPADTYRFARGEAIPIPPYAEDGSVLMTQKLERPLDFAAVTDHSEFFGEMKLCFDEESEAYDANSCRFLRGESGEGLSPFIRIVISEDPERVTDACGEDGSDCVEASLSLWQSTRDMAEEAYDRTSACRFTTFVGYEYTGTPRSNNYHRNVIFRNDRVPEYAISYIESPTDVELWEQLTEQCLEDVEGCDVLAIPHNSNLSSGAMFPSFISRFESRDTAREIAELRNAMEPVMEVFQHKGNSECFNGLPNILGAEDELCEQEQVRSVGREALSTSGEPTAVRFCEEGEIGIRGFPRFGCISRNDFLRSVLLTGLQDQAVIGVNSYKMGVIASTDGHISTAGDTHEHDWAGHLAPETDLETRLPDRRISPSPMNTNPGGLAGVWAVENSRDAIFESLRRKEVYGLDLAHLVPAAGLARLRRRCAPVLHDAAHDGVGQHAVVPLGGLVARRRPAGAQDDQVLGGNDVNDLVGVAVEQVEVGGEIGFAVQDFRHAVVRVGEAAPPGIAPCHPDAQAEVRVFGRGRDHFLDVTLRQ